MATATAVLGLGPLPAAAEVIIPHLTTAGVAASPAGGDFTGDGRTDIALVGGAGFTTVPLAMSTGTGAFNIRNYDSTSASDKRIREFTRWAGGTGVKTITGDFNADQRTDLALLPSQGTPWTDTLPVAFSLGDGRFNVTDKAYGGFVNSAKSPGVKVVSGDYNADGRTDIALLGTSESHIEVAFSNGDGTFHITGSPNSFSGLATPAGVKAVSGHFNYSTADGRTDIALIGASTTSIPLASSQGTGAFSTTSATAPNFAGWALAAGAKVVSGDLNGDGRTDLALTGVAGWTTIPVAFYNGGGTFNVTNLPSSLAGLAATPGVTVVSGDFNADKRTDIALTGGKEWQGIPVAMSNGNGTFNVTNLANSFAYYAAATGAKVTSGDFNADGRTDMALTGAVGWTVIPVAFSNGDGTFQSTYDTSGQSTVWSQKAFAKWAAPAAGPVDKPCRGDLMVDAGAVYVNWADCSDNEEAFEVQKRDKAGEWKPIYRVATNNRIGEGVTTETYMYVDRAMDISGQCYRMAALNSTHAGYSDEQCTVRPDPSAFPQSVPDEFHEWSAPSSVNGGVGVLRNKVVGGDSTYVVNDPGTFGVDLAFSGTSEPWTISAQGGPTLMLGQAVALHLAATDPEDGYNGGYLTYEDQNFGVDLGLDETPSYEWILIADGDAGKPINNSYAALWNTKYQQYLIRGEQTTGLNLVWFDPTPPPPPPAPAMGVKKITINNCYGSPNSPFANSRPQSLKFWVQDRTTGGPITGGTTIDTHWGQSHCPEGNGARYVFTPSITNHFYEITATSLDPSCNGEPHLGCDVFWSTFRGDTNGVEVFTNVG